MPRLKNDRWERFAQEYLIDANATQAAIRAGYSKNGAGQHGFKLLKNAEIRSRIAELQKARSKRTQITTDHVLTELGAVAFSDMANLAYWTNEYVRIFDSEEMKKRGYTRAVQSISKRSDGSFNIKLHSKVGAMRQIAEHLGMFSNQQQVRDDSRSILRIEFGDAPSNDTSAEDDISSTSV